MDESDYMGALLYTARETGKWMLDRFQRILPFGVILVGDTGEATSYFPKDKHPNASSEDLLDLVKRELRSRAVSAETRAVAALVEMESGRDRAMAVHAETRSHATLLFYPIKKRLLGGWKIGDPSPGDSLLFDRVFRSPQSPALTNGSSGASG